MNYTSENDWDIEDLKSPNDIIANALTLPRNYFVENLQGGGLERYTAGVGNIELLIKSDATKALKKIESIFQKIELTDININDDQINLKITYNFQGDEQNIIIGI